MRRTVSGVNSLGLMMMQQPGYQRGGEFPDGDHGGKIPRYDAHHHAHRFTQGECGVAFAVERGQRRSEGLAAELGRPARVVTQEVRGLVDLECAGNLDDLAGLAGLDLRQFFAIALQQVGELEQYIAACRG